MRLPFAISIGIHLMKASMLLSLAYMLNSGVAPSIQSFFQLSLGLLSELVPISWKDLVLAIGPLAYPRSSWNRDLRSVLLWQAIF